MMSFWDRIFGGSSGKKPSEKSRGETDSSTNHSNEKNPLEKNISSKPDDGYAAYNGSPRSDIKLSLEQELDLAWEYVQKKLYCFDIPYPQLDESPDCGTAHIDMSNHQIVIDKQFVKRLRDKGLDNQTIMQGLLFHEAGHYKIMPWDLKNLILMLYLTKKIAPQNSDVITNYFEDVCVNLDITLNKREDSIHQIYAANEKNSNMDSLMANLYSLKTGLDFKAPKLDDSLKKKLYDLGKIKFTSKKSTYKNLEKFTYIVKDVVNQDLDNLKKPERESGTDDAGVGTKRRSGVGRNYDESSEEKKPGNLVPDGMGLGSCDPAEVERVLKEMAGDVDDPDKFKDLYSFVHDELEKARKKQEGESELEEKLNSPKKAQGSKAGLGSSRKSKADQAMIQFYSAKAERYEVFVEDRDVLGGGDCSKTDIRGWDVDDPYTRVDVFKSYGKFMPEISKAWSDSGTAGERTVKSTPDLMVLIDSSGSMTNPKNEVSFAALGALCAARQYLKKGSKVSVANFSSNTEISAFSKDYDKTVLKILDYQGGGTSLDTEKIFGVISKNDRPVDVLLLSDGMIWNYNSVMKGLLSRKNTNRVTVAEISPFFFGGFSLDSRLKDEKINLYPIQKVEDIPEMVIGDMHEKGVM